MLTDKELRCLKETSLRNLKRQYAKLKEHPELTEQAQQIRIKIQILENELQ